MPATTVALVRPRPSARLLAAAATLLGLAVVLVAGLVAGALPASAHDALLSSVPAGGQTVERAPESILLTFSEAPLETGAQIVVTGPDGEQVEVGELTFDATTAGVKATLPTDVTGGTYTVAWHVVSSDGHPIEGTFSYAVPEPAAAPSQDAEATGATPEAAATPPADGQADDQADDQVAVLDAVAPTLPATPGDSSPTPLAIAASIAAAAVVAAAAFFAVRRKIQDNEDLRRNKPSEPTEPTEQSEPEDPENPKP